MSCIYNKLPTIHFNIVDLHTERYDNGVKHIQRGDNGMKAMEHCDNAAHKSEDSSLHVKPAE